MEWKDPQFTFKSRVESIFCRLCQVFPSHWNSIYLMMLSRRFFPIKLLSELNRIFRLSETWNTNILKKRGYAPAKYGGIQERQENWAPPPQVYLLTAVPLFSVPQLSSSKVVNHVVILSLPHLLPVAHIGMVRISHHPPYNHSQPPCRPAPLHLRPHQHGDPHTITIINNTAVVIIHPHHLLYV